MYKNNTILGIIPARGGSKGIPKKNIKILVDKPLITWTIHAAQKSQYIDKLIISTDSEEIAKMGSQLGAEIPFIRSSELAKDDSSGSDVIIHALDWFQCNRKTYDYFILLQPTSPFRKTEHIDKALEVIISKQDIDALVSIQKVDQHPYWMKKINKAGYLEKYNEESSAYTYRQSLPELYINNGAIYICKWDVFIDDRSLYKRNCYPFIMERKFSLDLDTMDDWKYAEYLLNNNIDLFSTKSI